MNVPGLDWSTLGTAPHNAWGSLKQNKHRCPAGCKLNLWLRTRPPPVGTCLLCRGKAPKLSKPASKRVGQTQNQPTPLCAGTVRNHV